jgi:hypothetical protein
MEKNTKHYYIVHTNSCSSKPPFCFQHILTIITFALIINKTALLRIVKKQYSIPKERTPLATQDASQKAASLLLLSILLASQCTCDTSQSKAIEDPVEAQRSEEVINESAETEAAQL